MGRGCTATHTTRPRRNTRSRLAFPVTITRGKCEVLTIAKDASNRLWVTFVESGRVKINWSVTGDLDWGLPVDLPLSAAAIDTANDDISAIVGFPAATSG